jgi:hypothetical protein
MKNIKIKIMFVAVITIGILGVFRFVPITFSIGKLYIPTENKTYFQFYFKEESTEFKELTFDFYKNDTLIVAHRYFVDKDSPPEIDDFHLFQYKGFTYITLYDSTKIKIICDDKLNIIYPCFGCPNFSEDSISRLPKIKELLMTKDLKLSRW